MRAPDAPMVSGIDLGAPMGEDPMGGTSDPKKPQAKVEKNATPEKQAEATKAAKDAQKAAETKDADAKVKKADEDKAAKLALGKDSAGGGASPKRNLILTRTQPRWIGCEEG